MISDYRYFYITKLYIYITYMSNYTHACTYIFLNIVLYLVLNFNNVRIC